MRNKLLFLSKVSFEKKTKSKWFLVANLIFLILIVGLINIDNIVKFFGGDFENKNELYVIDNVGCYEDFKTIYKEYLKYTDDISIEDIKLYNKDIDTGKKEIEKEHNKILLIINDDPKNYLKVELISYEKIGIINNTLITNTLNTIKNNIIYNDYNISEEAINKLGNTLEINQTNISKENSEDNYLVSTIIPIIILPFYLLSIFLISMIGTEVNEEKTTHSMEIIISNVTPKVHLLSKVIAGNLFILLQGLLLFSYSLVGIFIRYILNKTNNINGIIDNDTLNTIKSYVDIGSMSNYIYVIILMVIMVVITLLCYSLLAGVLASMTTNNEDYQQLQSPIIIISLIGYYLTFVAALFDGSIFIRVMSYIPFISAILSPVLLILGDITIIDFLISLGLMLLTLFVLIRYGMRIYKAGILNYSNGNLWQKMFKALKN